MSLWEKELDKPDIERIEIEEVLRHVQADKGERIANLINDEDGKFFLVRTHCRHFDKHTIYATVKAGNIKIVWKWDSNNGWTKIADSKAEFSFLVKYMKW